MSSSSPPHLWPLLAQAQAGDANSAQVLIKALTPLGLGVARRLLPRPEDAQDVVQDALLRLWKSRAHDQQTAQVQTYFSRIVINCAQTVLQKSNNWATDPDALQGLADQQAIDGHQPSQTASTPLEQQQLQQQVNQAIGQLPMRQRLVISLWAHADADVPALARELGLTDNAAHQLLHRAKQNLKQRLFGAWP